MVMVSALPPPPDYSAIPGVDGSNTLSCISVPTLPPLKVRKEEED